MREYTYVGLANAIALVIILASTFESPVAQRVTLKLTCVMLAMSHILPLPRRLLNPDRAVSTLKLLMDKQQSSHR